jgi:two-component system, NtrC family, sensor kinase
MLTRDRELQLYKFLEALAPQVKSTRDMRKTLSQFVRSSREFFQADHAVLVTLEPGKEAGIQSAFPAGGDWDLDLLARFIRIERPEIPHHLIMAPIRRRNRPWAVLALRRMAAPFERGEGHVLTRVTAGMTQLLEELDQARMLEVRDRIDRKIMGELRPKDLFYQILDGLRTLTRYDHSSALLVRDDASLTLAAEQIAWTKAKSNAIGLRLPMTEALIEALAEGSMHGFDRRGETWQEWNGSPSSTLAQLLDYNRGREGVEREACMLVAPVAMGKEIFGVLKIAAREPGSLGTYDARLVERFLSQVSMAIQNSQRTEYLHARMIEAEKKNIIAELARGVSHDVNNAIGAVLPLVQQMKNDIETGELRPEVFREDLDQIEQSLKVVRRIFGGMISMSHRGSRRTSEASLRQALDGTLAILKDGLERRGIEVTVQLSEGIGLIAGGQSDLEQVLLNLISNARDAMPQGGRLDVTARADADGVHVLIVDNGTGIHPEHLALVQEPFFTTKPQGTGLGLSICRSIVWEMEGKMTIESSLTEGTRVHLLFPGSKWTDPHANQPAREHAPDRAGDPV